MQSPVIPVLSLTNCNKRRHNHDPLRITKPNESSPFNSICVSIIKPLKRVPPIAKYRPLKVRAHITKNFHLIIVKQKELETYIYTKQPV